MSTEQPASTETQQPAAGQSHTWGTPQPPKHDSRWTGRKTLTAVAIAVGIAAVGGVAVYAGTSSNSEQGPGGMQPGMAGGQFPGQQGGPGRSGGMTAMLDALHGDFVVSDGNGGYETQRTQTGQVTKVGSSSITVQSDDGYTQTYAIDSSTQQESDPQTGDTVRVLATVSGDTATATTITSGDDLGGMGGMPGQQQGGPAGQPSGQPTN